MQSRGQTEATSLMFACEPSPVSCGLHLWLTVTVLVDLFDPSLDSSDENP